VEVNTQPLSDKYTCFDPIVKAATMDHSSKHPPSRPPMIGRESERVLLHEEISRAFGGEGRLAIIAGEAGIGKTTLALDVLEAGRRAGALGLVGHCHQLTSTPPYAPWLDLAASIANVPGAPPFPEAFANGHLSEFRSQTELFTDILDYFSQLARTQPLLILLEDMHWSDTASLELLRFLGTRLASIPVLIVITYRLDELTRTLPLYQQLPGLVRAGHGLRLQLKRIDRAAMTQLLRTRHRLEGDDEGRLAAYLERHAQGNPLFATELIRALEEEGVLVGAGDASDLDVLDHIVLPPLLTQVIDGRISRLGEEAREPLAKAAVIGEEVPLDLWAEISGIDSDSLLALIERAVESHILVASRDGTSVRFNHAITRDALYETSLPARRKLWHKQVAELLIEATVPDPDSIAHHLARAGDSRRAEWLVHAGNRAQRAYAWLIAAERFIEAAEALNEQTGTERERGWLLFRAARLMRLAHPERGLRLVRQAMDLARQVNDLLLMGDAQYSIGLLMCYSNQLARGVEEFRAGIEELEQRPLHILRGDTSVAFALADTLTQREATLDVDLESSVTLQAMSGMNHRRGGLAWWYAITGRPAESMASGKAFVRAVGQVTSPGGLVLSGSGHSWFGMGIANAQLGRPDEASASFEQARFIYRQTDHHGLTALASLAELQSVGLAYRADDREWCDQLAAESMRSIDQATGAFPPGFPATIGELPLMVLRGRWNEATDLLAETMTPENIFHRFVFSSAKASIAFWRGQYSDAWAEVRQAMPLGPEQPWKSRQFQEGLFFQRLAAELALVEGDLPTAHGWLASHRSWLEQSGAVAPMADAASVAAKYEIAAGNIDRARVQTIEALEHATRLGQPLARLTVHQVMAEVELGRSNETAAFEQFEAGLELARRCEAAHATAEILTSVAEFHHRRGDVARERVAAQEALVIARGLGAGPLLHRLETFGADQLHPAKAENLHGLTTREVEVLLLVAQGLTDAAVASRLFISPRTVGQHLRSIYGKIDVSSRSAATRFAIEHGLA
jgi:DNA-binding CsgD family transcriptional regulator/tetratricopeptide (TPR) repeat protein